jgi:ribosomal protein S18 acetylase RimI-like enzyme
MVRVRERTKADGPWIESRLQSWMGSQIVAAHGDVFRPAEHPAFVAEDDGRRVGLLTYRFDGNGGLEVLTIESAVENRGIGTALIEAAIRAAREAGCSRLWLITTNDNLDAMRFYQRRGMRFVALRAGAVDEARRTLKPEISETGAYDIPIRDELELELELG